MAAQNLYSDYQESDRPAPEKQGTEDSDEPSTLIPKSLLAGKHFEVGDEVVLKIVAMHEDEVEVAYSYGEEGKGDKENTADEEAPSEGGMSESQGNPHYY